MLKILTESLDLGLQTLIVSMFRPILPIRTTRLFRNIHGRTRQGAILADPRSFPMDQEGACPLVLRSNSLAPI